MDADESRTRMVLLTAFVIVLLVVLLTVSH
jgi:hypothetical protein